MLEALFVLVLLAAFMQPTPERAYAAGVFVSLTLVHEAALSHLEGFAYYGSAALFDLFVILATRAVRPLSQTIIDLHRLCLVCILLNLGGWVLWRSYSDPAAYNVAFLVVYAWALVIFSTRKRADVGGFAVGWRGAGLYRHTLARFIGSNQHGGAV